jgi:H+/Cl- antiporter ClcA
MPPAEPSSRVDAPSSPQQPPAVRPDELLRSRAYLAALILGAVLGVPVAAVAYVFLAVIGEAQQYLFVTLPTTLGFDGAPAWWPIPLLTLSGLLVALIVRRLPGTGGHEPAEGFEPSGPVRPGDLPGIVLAALATLSLGVVLGPEAPLIALGSGLGVLAIRLFRRDAPTQAVAVVAAASSFAAISTLLISPLAAAFLLMEASGIGGPMLGVVLVPGLLAAGIGTLIFLGLNSLTGLGTFSLGIPDIPAVGPPTVAEFAWAIVIGLAAAVLGGAIRRLALALQPIVARHRLTVTPLLGLSIGVLAVVYAETSGRTSGDVLFSGQSALPSLLENAADWTVDALVLLIVCKGLAYAAALAGFRGGPTFPGMFLGAVGGIALGHLPGLPMIAGAAMGIGAMTVVMLRLPLTAVLLTAIFIPSDALRLTPLIIVAVVVAYVADARYRGTADPADDQPARDPRAGSVSRRSAEASGA